MLTDEELGQVREEVGDTPTDDQLHQLHDELGTVRAVVRRVLRVRLANLLAEPAQFSVPGEYSQSTQANIDALKAKLASIESPVVAARLTRDDPDR